MFDAVIIGSGLGGLECGLILSKEGYNVCVLEQSSVFGGCLQSFKRHGVSFDTGIHYVGSMDQGQIMNQFFRYFGILDSLKIRKMDVEAFDVIHFGDDQYHYAQGHERFYETIAARFPREREGLRRYCDKIHEVGSQVSVENFRKGIFTTGGIDNYTHSASEFIDSCVTDERLRNVLGGTNSLYGGIRDVSTLYHHAIINYSYVEGAYRFVDGTQAIADLMVAQIRSHGSQVLANSRVKSIVMKSEGVECVELENGERIYAKQFISSLHPATTFNMVQHTPLIKKAYRTRLNSLSNSYGLFTVNMVMKPSTFRYINSNHYIYRGDDAWRTISDDGVPECALLSCQPRSGESEFCEVVSLLSPMKMDRVEQWADTKVAHRGQEYEEFKAQKAEQILKLVSGRFASLEQGIDRIYTATPLTYRDYTAVPDGSAYGIVKNCQSPIATIIPPRTKIPNLLLTGQNLNVHGAMGVSLTAALTCSELLGAEYLAQKIGNA